MSPRESYCVFPAWSNGFWTWFTGSALNGEVQPTGQHGPWSFLLLALASYTGGIALAIKGAGISNAWGWVALAVGWCLAVSGARRIVSTVVHQCIHSRFTGRRELDQFVGELLTVLTFTQAAEDYRREHFEQHHRFGIFSTKADPAAQFLVKIGFRPGLSVPTLWTRLLLNVISPLFHYLFFAQRAVSNFIDASPMRMAAAYLHLLAWCAVLAFGWIDAKTIVVGFVVPVVFLYQISVMLEFVSEHAWFVPAPPVMRARDIHRTHSWGRFCGSATPAHENTSSTLSYIGQWVSWSLAHVLYHLPVRLMVLPGDLPQHDFHHRSPNTTDWPMAAFARQRYLIDASEPALEFWGLHQAINHVFNGLAAASPCDATQLTGGRGPFEENEV